MQRCLSLALQTLIEMRDVEHFHAIATPVMARRWRRFGMHPTVPHQAAAARVAGLGAGAVLGLAPGACARAAGGRRPA